MHCDLGSRTRFTLSSQCSPLAENERRGDEHPPARSTIRDDGDSGEWVDWLIDESADQETVFAASEEFNHRRKALAEALSALEGRDRRIFEGRRLGGDPIPLAELAAEFGVSGERVRQIEMRAFEKVQKAVKNRVAPFEKSSSAM